MGGASRFIMLLTTPFPLLHHSRPSFLRLARHSRLCSSFASLSHLSHLNHSSASRLQFVFPVKSSEQFHTQTSCVQEDQFGVSSDPPPASHPWREWSNFIETLSKSRCFEHQRLPEDEFVVYEDMSEEFVRASGACLAFARERWELLGSLSRRDMMVIVENGTPFIFKSALDTARRMRAFLGIGGGNVLESDKAHTVDLMKYLLSYASNPVVSSERSGHYRGELIEVSVRNLLSELCRLSSGVAVTGHPASVQNHFPDGYGQPPMAPQQNITMKRGDWICSRCSFMNFARNSKCLECEEARPKRQLTGGEWECPQCDFFNYGRNAVCLRCDCTRPGETSVSSTSSSPGLGYRNAVSANKPDIDSRLVANEEKAQRWFSKISQMDSASDMASAADDEDFPEIMPMRKGVNRFVVSTRKTPLERRLANSQYQRNLSDDSSVPNSNFQAKGGNTPSSRKLDEILGNRPIPISDSVEKNSPDGQNAGTERTRPLSFASPPQNPYPKGSKSTYVPFVPLPNDMFAKNPDTGNEKIGTKSTISESSKSATSVNQPGNTIERSGLSETPSNMVERQDTEKAQADKSGTWLEKIAELHDVNDLSSAVPDDDFPDIMPMRKGENRFVVSKKKDRSLTTPMYKRKSVTEQTGSTNFVPFVPFPPDYFTKKDKHPGAADAGSVLEAPSNSEIPEELDENKPGMQKMENNQPRTMNYAADNSSGRNATQTFEPPVGRSSVPNSPTTGYTGTEDGRTRLRENISQQPENSKKFDGGGWSGKSLEGSAAVQEPDPLDMSEEAKAQRWFRRVAQIKDISELSDIPDEDFPSIMPMRKGVNRFVVSKRKTPLERRLTSSQYRKSLPVVNSDPFKKENDSS